MKVMVPITICAVLSAVMFLLVLSTPWYTISFESEGKVEMDSARGFVPAHGEATATEDYYLVKQVNTSDGSVNYQFERLYHWEDAKSESNLDRGTFKGLFIIQFVLVLVEILLFIGNGVLLVLASLGRMKKGVLLLGLSIFVLVMLGSSLYLPIALPPRIEEEPENHLPGSVGPRLNESQQKFVPLGISEETVNRTIDEITDVRYKGGLYGSDSNDYQTSVDGGTFKSKSSLSWYPSVGWFAHVIIGVLGVFMFLLAIRLDIKKREKFPDLSEYEERTGPDKYGHDFR